MITDYLTIFYSQNKALSTPIGAFRNFFLGFVQELKKLINFDSSWKFFCSLWV